MARHTGGESAWTDKELEMLRELAEHYKESGAIPVDDEFIEHRRRRYAARNGKYRAERPDPPKSRTSRSAVEYAIGAFAIMIGIGLTVLVMLR